MEQLSLDLREQSNARAHVWEELTEAHRAMLIEVLARLIAKAVANDAHEEPADD